MLKFLHQPYPFENSLKKRLVLAFCIGVFVFLFLYVFKPFDLASYPKSIVLLTLGYGFATFVVMVIMALIMLFTFQNYFTDTNWTTGKEMIWTTLMVVLIGFANTLYTTWVGVGNLGIKSIVLYQLYTLAVGIFPVTISIVINQIRLKNNFEKASLELNKMLDHKIPNLVEKNSETPADSESEIDQNITFVAENGKDEYTFKLSEILFLKSADNYVDVFFLQHDQTNCELIRTTLKKCETILNGKPNFFRCHKSYLVNLVYVNRVSGNAQGYKLHLAHTSELIPVSRAHNETIKKRFAN